MKPAFAGTVQSILAIRPCHPTLLGKGPAAADRSWRRHSRMVAAAPRFSRKLRRAQLCCQP
eukprot:4010693-Pyramimonas_sp.AAC.1